MSDSAERRAQRLEVTAWLLFAVCLGAMEGGVVSVMVRTFYRHAVAAATLDYTVALLVGAPVFANIASLGWASAGHGRGPARLLGLLQLLCVVCLLCVAAAPRTAAGLAMVAAGAVSARLLWSGVLTLRTSVWRLAYERHERTRLAGRVVAVHYLAVAATGAVVGASVDRWPQALPWLYLGVAGLGLAGAVVYRLLARGFPAPAALAAPEPTGERRARPRGSLATFRAILRGDADFRRYLFRLFVLDSGVQMVTAPLLIGLGDRFAWPSIEQTLLVTTVPMVVVPAAIPLLARRLARMHVVEFRVLHSWTYVVALALAAAGLLLRAEACLWLGALALGVGYAGGSITWHLGHHDFATPEQAPHYMSLNVALTGVRGVLAPSIGVSLYKLAEHALPGQGPLALLVPLALAVWGALGFASLALARPGSHRLGAVTGEPRHGWSLKLEGEQSMRCRTVSRLLTFVLFGLIASTAQAVPLDPCNPNPCQNGGACADVGGTAVCTCTAGWTGPNCQFDINECASNPCFHGLCTDQVNGYSCSCGPGWTGANCDIDIDECDSSPCVNGLCTNQANGYSCACLPGWTGPNCGIDIDECQSNPCVHGQCTDQVNGFSCSCEPGWTGIFCEIPIAVLDCSGAVASPGQLWPPNHQLVPVEVLDVIDPSGGAVAITFTSVFQDEPVNGTGSGDTSPDAVGVGTGSLAVRAERAGNGDGRVYHIAFSATSSSGGSCTGAVTVGVPKSQGKKGAPVDGGALYDSTLP